MKRIIAISIFLTVLFASSPAEARPLGQNIALIGLGGVAIVAGVLVAGPSMALAATALITCGIVTAGIGVTDEIYKVCAKQLVNSGVAWEEDTKIRRDADDAMRDFEKRQREWQDAAQKESEKPPKKKRRWSFIKSAEAGELEQEAQPSHGKPEPSQPTGQSIADNSKKDDNKPVQKPQRRDADGTSTQRGDADGTSTQPANDDSETGIRGWGHCWERKRPGYDSLLLVGSGNLITPEHFGEGKGDYSYRICTNCGRCYTIRKIGDMMDPDIIDWRIYDKYHEQAGESISVREFKEMLIKAEDKLLAIPDGKIVIPGTCNCKRPDPVSVALVVNDRFFVCCFCGRVRLPGKNGNMPTGPTNWRFMMGPDKPFPGFKD